MRAGPPSPATRPDSTCNAPPTRLARVLGLPTFLLWGYALVLLVEHARLQDVKFNDARIHFRYAGNVAHGLGLVYQAGERVLGWAFADPR